MVLRILEIIFFFYFASHIPITIFIDLQALLPEHVYPQAVSLDWSDACCCCLRKTCLAPVIKSSWNKSFFALQLKDVLRWYAAEFRDPMILDPPVWFKSFLFFEALLQLPFFPIAAYAFLKGQCIMNPTATGHYINLIPCSAYHHIVHSNLYWSHWRWRLIYLQGIADGSGLRQSYTLWTWPPL